MARPRVNFPPGARDLLLSMAGNGLRETVAARALGLRLSEFKRIVRKNRDAKDIWEAAMAIERDKLLDALYNRALEGDSKAAQFLLAARHGLSDKAPENAAQAVQITFQLPSAMDASDYMKVIQPQPAQLEEQPI